MELNVTITRGCEARILLAQSTLRVLADLAQPETCNHPPAQINREALTQTLWGIIEDLELETALTTSTGGQP